MSEILVQKLTFNNIPKMYNIPLASGHSILKSILSSTLTKLGAFIR